MREKEIAKVLHDLEKTYAGCQTQLEQKLMPKKEKTKGTISGRRVSTVESSAIRPSVVSSSQLYMPAAQPHASFQPLSSSTIFDPYCQSALKLQL